MEYTPKTDAVLETSPFREFESEDFEDLALACLDQAGCSPAQLLAVCDVAAIEPPAWLTRGGR